MWTHATIAIFAILGAGCDASLKPTMVPISIVPITNSGTVDKRPLHDAFLTVNVAVGTPEALAQRMNLTLDFGFDSSFIFDSSPASLNCYPVAPRHYYTGVSATFYRPFLSHIRPGYKLRYPYGGDCNNNIDLPVIGHVAQDTWKVGAQSVPEVTFVFGQNRSSLLSNRWASDGILGFSKWGKTETASCGDEYEDRCSTAMETLLGPYYEKIVSLYFQRPTSPVTTATPSGSLTFGGYDSEHCSGWTPLEKSAYYMAYVWSATIDGVTLGARGITRNSLTAVFDPTSEFIYMSHYEDIAHLLNAEYDFPSDSYVVQCDAVKSLPDLVFMLSKEDYGLPATDYARQTASDVGKKTCTLMFWDNPTWGEDETWTLGTTFLRNYCVALDYSSGLVNIAGIKA